MLPLALRHKQNKNNVERGFLQGGIGEGSDKTPRSEIRNPQGIRRPAAIISTRTGKLQRGNSTSCAANASAVRSALQSETRTLLAICPTTM